MNTMCEVCGDIGFKHLLSRCKDCACSAAHLYCMEKVVFEASLANWVCYECLQNRGEVAGGRSLETMSSERQPSHAHFDSAVHQPVTKRVKLARGVGLRGKRKSQNPRVRKTNAHCVEISSSSQHSNTESSESSRRFVECQSHHGKTVEMDKKSSSSKEPGENMPSESRYLDSDDLQAPAGGDYVLSRTSYLSEAQKERVTAFIQETKPEITVFVSVIGRTNVQLPGPYLGISKEYAFAYFPHESTEVTLQRPGMSKKWHLLFYKRDENRKNMLMGRWLDFVSDNNVQEGDICLLEPTKDEEKSVFTVYLLRTSATHATCGDCFPGVDPCPGESITKMASKVHNKEEPSNEKHISSEGARHEISDESEIEDSSDPSPSYILPCRHDLSKSQKKVVEERVRAIRSDVPIYVTVMKNNNAGSAQRWMLELGVRYAAVYLPSGGRTVVLQRMGKTWNTQMVIHNGRRWFLNGGWTKFARDNGLRVGDVCLFELKKNKRNLTMIVHIISKEQL